MGSASFTAYAKRNAFPNGHVGSVRNGMRYLEQAYSAWPDAQTAMEMLGEHDRYENGHMTPDNVGGKMDLVHIGTVATREDADRMADELMEAGDARILDKRGPAGCITIETGDEQFLFFGWVAT